MATAAGGGAAARRAETDRDARARGRFGAERVEIQAGGRVTGTIETKTLILVEGGTFEGDCRMSDEHVDAFERPARGG